MSISGVIMEKRPGTFENIKNKAKNGFSSLKKKTKDLFAGSKTSAEKTAASSKRSRNLEIETSSGKSVSGTRTSKSSPSGSGTVVYRSDETEKKISSKSQKAKQQKMPANLGHLFREKKHDQFFLVGTVITIAKILGICLVIVAVAAVGAVFGVAKAYLGTTPDLDLVAINDNDLTSYIYDSKGNLITTYAGMENRDYATLDEIPDLLEKAVISIEDARFYSHPGVDLKGLIGAFVGNISSNSVSGGSTITQQLIKNKILTNEKSYKRKIQEMSLAIQLEKVYTKDQILEAYLNTMPLGGTNYGVKAASLDYFGKELDELSLREIACLAGITQYPWKYSPRRVYYVTHNIEDLDKRIDRVLQRMYEYGYITLDQLNEAKADTLTVNEKSIVTDLYDYPHFVEYGIHDVVTHLLKQRNLEDTTANRKAVNNELRTSGYHIYLTVDPEMQELVQTTLSEAKYPKLAKGDTSIVQPDGTETIQPQAAAVVYDYRSGELKAIVGGRDKPTTAMSLNRAYQSRMPVGSSIKPIAVYGPAFDLGCGLGTIIENIPVKIPGWGTEKGYPTTSTGSFGPTSLRKAIVSSLNICAARTLMTKVGLETSYNYLVNLGVKKDKINVDGVGLALGSSGITVIEMAGAYSAIANSGIYKEPLSFSKVLDSSGNVVLDANTIRDEHQVFKRSTSFMLVTALKEAVSSGTGWRAKIKGITTCGKTGTVANNKGVFFAGFTGYYISTIWVGHDNFKTLPHSYGGDTAAPIWKTYMSKIHEGLEDRDILDGGASDYGAVKKSVCAVSGLKPHAGCPTVSDYFGKDGGPTKECNMHASASICTVSGEMAGIYCPADCITTGSGVIIPKDSPYAQLPLAQLKSIIPNVITGSIGTDTDAKTNVCSYHNQQWYEAQQHAQAAKEEGSALLSLCNSLLSEYKDYITDAQKSKLQAAMSPVSSQVASSDVNEFQLLTDIQTLRTQYNTLLEEAKKAKQEAEATPPTPPTPPDPGTDPDPGTNPDPGTEPGTDPGTDPGTNPDPGTDPGTDPHSNANTGDGGSGTGNTGE